jgi:hypothetical protein
VAERFPEPPPPRTYYDPIGPTGEVARKNVRLGILLFVTALLIAVGAVVVSLIYLQFD